MCSYLLSFPFKMRKPPALILGASNYFEMFKFWPYLGYAFQSATLRYPPRPALLPFRPSGDLPPWTLVSSTRTEVALG
jgi:hypothetical protein